MIQIFADYYYIAPLFFRPSVCLACPSSHLSVRKIDLVHTKIHHRFVLESPKLHQTCILGYSLLVLKKGVIDVDLQGNYGHFDSDFYEIWLVLMIICDGFELESPNLHLNLKMYQGYLNQCTRTAQKEYYVKEITKYENDSRKTWDTLKGIICMNKMKSEYPWYFVDKGQQIAGDENIADKFNEYFTQIGTSLANSIDISKKRHLLTLILKKTNSFSFKFKYIDVPNLQKIVNNLKPKSSTGHDNISSKLLRQVGDIVAYPLSTIMHSSLCTGIFPNWLILAKVIPLYKKDDNNLFRNHPMTLLSSLSKVFEQIVFDQLYDYLITSGLLFVSQYGFRKQHSTELAALELMDWICHKIDQNKIPFSVFLDLLKAFDTLNHHLSF